MSDYYELDFIDVPSNKGGDAITLRYCLNGKTSIHVIDAGYIETGDKVIKHINQFYGNPQKIDHVVLTHQDNDHAGGLRSILENYKIGKLWMHRPWLYTDELLPRFSRFQNANNLKVRLREIYSNAAALEEIALKNNIEIGEPFQGERVGVFTIVSPTKSFF